MLARSRNSHEATLDILTDGSELTEPAIFLTIRRFRRQRCDDVAASGPVVGSKNDVDDANNVERATEEEEEERKRRSRKRRVHDTAINSEEYYQRVEQCTHQNNNDDGGIIVSRYNLTGLSSLTTRLACDQRYNILKAGAFQAVLIPSLITAGPSPSLLDSKTVSCECCSCTDDLNSNTVKEGEVVRREEEKVETTTIRNACLVGLPSLLLNLIKAGYGGGDNLATARRDVDGKDDDDVKSSSEDDNVDVDDDEDDAASLSSSFDTNESNVDINNDNDGDGNSATMDSEVIKREQHQKQQQQRYGEVSFIGPPGTVPIIDGMLDVIFGKDGHSRRARPSIRACEVPPLEKNGCWWEVYNDVYVRIWGRSVLIHQKKDKMEEDKVDKYAVIYIVMLLPQRMYNDDEDKDDYDGDYNNNDVDYSFAIVPHVSDDFNNDLSCWSALRDIPQEVVNNHQRRYHHHRQKRGDDDDTDVNRRRHPLLDFILHLNPPSSSSSVVFDLKDYKMSDDRSPSSSNRKRCRMEERAVTGATNNDIDESRHMAIEKVPMHNIDVPSWTIESNLVGYHLITRPDHHGNDTDDGLLILASRRARILNKRLPFAFPLSSSLPNLKHIIDEVRCQGLHRDRPSSSYRALAFGLRSCTSVVLNGWGGNGKSRYQTSHKDDNNIHRPFVFVSRIEDIRARCEGGLATRQRTEVDGNNHFNELMTDDVDFAKAARSIECSFTHNASPCLDIDQIDENEIDLNDDSCSDEGDMRVQLKDDRVIETDTAEALLRNEHSPSILMLGTGCATPSPMRGGSAYALLMPTTLNGKSESILSALIECGEGTLTALRRHLPQLNSHQCDSTTNSASTRLNNHLSHVCFIWISHSHLDHYGDLPIVIQAITNAKIMPGCRHRQANQLLVIAPSKVLKYLNVLLLGQQDLPRSKDNDGSNQQMYVGVTHRELSYSPFARHLLSLITNYALPTPPTLQDSDQGRSQNCCYNPFVSLQNVDVEHCMDSFGLILEINLSSYTNQSNIGSSRCNNPSRFLLCFSGDTRPTNNLIQKCRSYSPSRVDLLIHEGTFLDDPRGCLEAVRKRHSTTAEALDVASRMNAKACLITHFSQQYKHIYYDDVSSGQVFPWLGVAFDGIMVPLTEQALMSLSSLTHCIDFLIRELSH